MKIGTPDGEKVLAAIDNLGSQGAQGFVICAPDVRLGPAIAARAKRYNMKFVTVDDQLVDSTGKRCRTCRTRDVGDQDRQLGWRSPTR